MNIEIEMRNPSLSIDDFYEVMKELTFKVDPTVDDFDDWHHYFEMGCTPKEALKLIMNGVTYE